MNLYRDIKTGVFSGTQAIAKSIGPFVPVEVPVDKAGLIEYLNDSLPPAPSGLESEQELTPEPHRTVEQQPVIRDEHKPVSSSTMVRKQVIVYLDYNPSIDEVVNVRMVSQMDLARDNYPAWNKLDQELTEERKESFVSLLNMKELVPKVITEEHNEESF